MFCMIFTANNMTNKEGRWCRRSMTYYSFRIKGSFNMKSHTQKMNHFRLFSYLVHKVYILWDFIILNISLLLCPIEVGRFLLIDEICTTCYYGTRSHRGLIFRIMYSYRTYTSLLDGEKNLRLWFFFC